MAKSLELRAKGQRDSVSGPQPSALSPQPEPDTTTPENDLILPDLSDAQILFLESEPYRKSGEEVMHEFALTEDDLTFLNEMDHAILGGLINLNQYVTALRAEFPNLNASEKDRLIGELLADRFVPFGTDLRPSAEEAAREAKIAIPPKPYYHVYTKPLTFGGAAHEIALMAGIPLMGQTQERIREVFMTRLKGVRSDRQAEEQLTRGADVGGVGAKAEAAKLAIAAMDDIAGRATLMTEEEYAAWVNRSMHPPSAEAASASTPAAETEEEKEIREIVARMPEVEKDNATALATAIRAVMERLSWRPDDPYLQRRLTNMVSTRLRDVRSRNEFFMKLMRDVKVGGLGLERKAAERLTDDVEKGYAEFRDKIAVEEKTKLDAQILEQERKIEERKRREAEERQKWYEDKVATKKRTEEVGKQAFQRLRIAARGLTSPIEPPVIAKDQAREKAAFGDLVPAAPEVSGKREAGSGQEVKPGKIPNSIALNATKFQIPNSVSGSQPLSLSASQPVVSGTEERKMPEPSVVKVSAKTAELRKAAEGSRPKLDDVVSARGAGATHLAGPMEQIGGMTLEQFRRLAKTPEASAKRVEDIVALLAQESFERRVAGIQAWQKSPLQTLYLKLLAEAFRSGKQVGALVEEKRKAGEVNLTPEELEAIVKLNGVLRL